MKNSLRSLVLTALFIAITVVIQALRMPQFTGPLVNCMLLLSALFVGPIAGILVGLITPWVVIGWHSRCSSPDSLYHAEQWHLCPGFLPGPQALGKKCWGQRPALPEERQ